MSLVKVTTFAFLMVSFAEPVGNAKKDIAPKRIICVAVKIVFLISLLTLPVWIVRLVRLRELKR